MKQLLLPVLLFLNISSCLFIADVGDDDLGCEIVERIDQRILNAVPYSDGQVLTFDVSTGGSFSGAVTQSFLGPSELSCFDLVVFNYTGANDSNELTFEIDLCGCNNVLDFRVDIRVNGVRRDDNLFIELAPIGELSTDNNSFERIIADTTINGRAYRDVFAQDYGFLNPGVSDLKCSYYNLSDGLIGVEMLDGSAIWLRSN